jgi:RimJ/RimL family protein N-acetyltransferase
MSATVVRVENEKVELHTSRLRLRGATTHDPEHLYNAFTDPEVMRYW